MPTTAIINLRAMTEGRVHRSFHCLMHPIFLERISRVNPDLGKKLHSAGRMTPFSLSPVMTVNKRIQINESYWVRIGMLTNELEEAFLDSLEKGIWNEPLQMENHGFAVEDIIFGKHPKNPWAGRESYTELIARKDNSTKIWLMLASPLSFKKGDLHYPLPEISFIFRNLARRWNLFSEFKVPVYEEFPAIGYSYFNIKTRPYALRKGGTIIGAVGKLAFILKGPPEEVMYANLLLRFGFYSGIGVKTTQGMGMYRILYRNYKQIADNRRPIADIR